MAGRRKSQLSFEVSVNVLPKNGFPLVLEADRAECLEIAGRADLPEVSRFRAELLFRRWRKDGVSVKGNLHAEIVQTCVVSLEPVKAVVDEEIDRLFLPEGSRLLQPRLDSQGELLIDPEGGDIPDAFSGDTIDAWEILLEHFMLGIDPFPRKEGVGLPSSESGDDTDAESSPFAKLARLRGEMDKD